MACTVGTEENVKKAVSAKIVILFILKPL
ncbi:hypothetical protein VIBNISFn118_560022 [Vibrio nigripulchritudo SFn118]|nr:hypothetical protein VIBNISFn118_560022 [Vibrio nigripulchritudo SFn118]